MKEYNKRIAINFTRNYRNKKCTIKISLITLISITL